jgi:hypothetical protein
MQSELNPLRRELARGQHGEPHPDSDLLTALAEGTLPQRERHQVLEHLAVCSDCRKILSIAAAVAMHTSDDLKPFVLTRPSRLPQRTWLPWASVAAGLLVVCSAVLFYQQRHTFQNGTTVANKEAVQLPSSALQQSSPLPSLKKPETLGTKANSQRSSQLQAPLPSQNMTGANAVQVNQSAPARRFDFRQPNSFQTGPAAGEMVTSGASVQQAASTQSISAFTNTAPSREISKASFAATARPHWRINSGGQPERAFGEGEWQAVLPHEQSRMRVVSVFDSEVWIGGDSMRLYHSTDNGTTWRLVALPGKDGREHSIAHIHFQTAQSGTVESDDGTVWITSDGGRTWK